MKKRRKLKRNVKKIFVVVLILLVILVGVEGFILATKKLNKGNNKELIAVAKEIKKIDVNNSSMSLIAVGDALIHRGVYYDAQTNEKDGNGYTKYDFKKMFTYIKDIIAPYDIRFYNQETIIGGKNLGLSNYPLFNSPDEIGLDLLATGFNTVNLATNHTLDKGAVGATYSANFWHSDDKKDIYVVGSYKSAEDRNAVVIKEINGITYSILAYTTYTNGIPVPSGKEYLVNVYDKEQVKKDIEAVRDKVDVLIVSMHWGTEYTNTKTSAQVEIAEYLSSLGVNLIIGHHPHVVESIEYVGDTLVIYSLGNFISAQDGINKRTGLIAALNINKKTVGDKSYIYFDDVKADLLWTHQVGYKNFKVIPFPYLTEDILKNHASIYEQYKKYINITNDDRIKVGFITKE